MSSVGGWIGIGLVFESLRFSTNNCTIGLGTPTWKIRIVTVYNTQAKKKN